MRRVLIVLGVGLVLLLATLVVVPMLFKEQLSELVVTTINDQVDATVVIGETNASLLSDFPHLGVELNGVRVSGKAPFEGIDLALITRLDVTVDLLSLMGSGPVEIIGLELVEPRINMLIDEEGRSNTEIYASGDDSEPAAPASEDEGASALSLRDLVIDSLELSYEDRAGGMLVKIHDLDLTADASLSGEAIAVRTQAESAGISVRQDGVDLLREVKTSVDLDLSYASPSGRIELGSSRVGLNDLAVVFEGAIAPQDEGTELDLRFAAEKASFKSLLSLVPAAYSADFAQVSADGSFTLEGKVAGLMPAEGDALPGFDIQLEVADGHFQYPDLPSAVQDIQLSAQVRHPGGDPDLMEIDIGRFHLALDGSPLDGRLSLRTPSSDPRIDTQLKGSLDLGKLTAALPADGTTTTGILDVDMTLVGRLSDFEAVDVDAVQADGTIELVNVVYTDAAQPMPITIERLELGLQPRRLDLASFKVRFGKSDLSASGSVDNALGYLLADQTLTGRFDIRSKMLDLTPWETAEGEESTPAESTEAGAEESSLVAVPGDLDLALDLDCDQVQTTDYELRNMRGEARLSDGAIGLDGLNANMLGGRVSFDGEYRASNTRRADVDMTITAKKIGVAETIAQFTSIEQIVPIARDAVGQVSTGLSLKTSLSSDLSPDLMSLFSEGQLTAKDLTLAPAFLAAVAEFLDNDRFGTMLLEPRPLGFKIDGGKLQLDRVSVRVGQAKGTLSGQTGVEDGSLDLVLDLDVPLKAIKGTQALQQAVGAKSTVGLQAQIGGTWQQPKVKVSLSETTRELVEEAVGEVVDQAIDEARVQADRLLAEAQKQADRLRDEAVKAGDELRAIAKKKGKQLVKKAKGNPLKEVAAKEAAKQLNKQADKQAKKLVSEADKAGDKVIATARKKADQLLDEAASKARR